MVKTFLGEVKCTHCRVLGIDLINANGQQLVRSSLEDMLLVGLPKSQFGSILEGLGMDNVGIFSRSFGILYKENSGNPGVDVMIIIFSDFCQFLAKKWRFKKMF
jgi:hypothetical protein